MKFQIPTVLSGRQQIKSVGWRAVALCLVIAMHLIGWPQEKTATANLPPLLQTALPSADVAVLFDASLSMRNQPYGEARQAVIAFASSLTDKEILHLRVFGDVAGAPLEGPAGKLSSNVADHLPAEPIFHNTDLGVAISKALEFFERPHANEVQALFLLTDGLHQPPAGSPFSRDFSGDPDWQDLHRRARTLSERRKVLVYGFGLGQRTDVFLLLRLFPATNVEVVSGNAAQIAATLQRVRENLRLSQLRHAIEQDLRAGKIESHFALSDMKVEAEGIPRTVTIRNGYQYLPVVIRNVELLQEPAANREIGCTIENAPHDLTLAPGQLWQGDLRCGLQTKSPRWRIGRSERIYRTRLRLLPTANFTHEAEIARLISGPAAPRHNSSPLRIELRDRYGVPYWLLTVSLLILSGLVWLTRQRRKQMSQQRATVEQRHAERMRLAGRLKIWPKTQSEPSDEGTDLSIHKARQLDLLMNAEGSLLIALPGTDDEQMIAHLSGHLAAAAPDKAESGRVEFRLEAARGHRLTYESGDELREAARVILCDRDLIEIDGLWRLRYANHRMRTRAEVESARSE